MSNQLRILVLFVEPMLYGLDLIHEVYEQTPYEYSYIYCTEKLTGKDDIMLPDNSFICNGSHDMRKKQIITKVTEFNPNFIIINGYVGFEQKILIKYCQKYKIKYAIESDTPLHIPSNIIKALMKKIYLKRLLYNEYCYGFPGGTLQKENFIYYGIPENKNYIMPMSVSKKRLLKEYDRLPSKEEIKSKYSLTNKKVFLFVGRLEKVKNVSLLINAFKDLKASYNDCALVIVGDGSQRNALKELSQNIDDIYFMGYQVYPKLIEYYKLADIFVLPSSYESWGLVINEALTFGIPVIVSDKVGCYKDIVKDGINGYVFENNNISELLHYLKITLMDDHTLTEQCINCNYSKYLMSFKNMVDKEL